MAYFPDSIHLDPCRPLPPHFFPNSPVIKDKRVEFFHYILKLHKFFIIKFSISISVFFSYANKSYFSKHTEVFERQIQPHEMVTQSPAIIFNQC